MNMFDRSLDSFVFFGDFGIDILVNGVVIKAIADNHDKNEKASRQRARVLRVLTSDAIAIDTDTIIEFEGSKFRVYKKDVMMDGLFTKLEAEKKNG